MRQAFPAYPTKKNAREVEIRAATGEDEPGILACLRRAFEAYRTEYSAQAFADTVLDRDSLRVREQRMHLLVALSAEGIVGTVAGSCIHGEGHLRGMAVVPEWQGSGVAKGLLQAIENWLKQEGCRRVTLDTTLPLQPAIKFYEKYQYRRSGKVSDFYGMPLIEYVKELR
jgi:GNAT superfamily N-acetyltransferase